MKKFFEKHDLVKIALGMILLTVILTWIIPQGNFNGAELVKGEITRVGIFDLFTYGLLGMYYFTVMVTFLFVLGAVYQYLSDLPAYQNLTSSIAKKIKGKEIVFSIIVSFIFTALAAMVNETMVLLAFMPFVITVCLKAGFKKISAFVTTFGAMLVGIMGSVIGTKVAGMNVQYLGTTYTDKLWIKIVFVVLAFVIYSVFNILYMKKSKTSNKTTNKKSSKKDEELVVEDTDLFETVETKEKQSAIPLIVVSVLAMIVILLAYLPWTDVFKVEWFNDAFNWITEAKLFGSNIFAYILGNTDAQYGTVHAFGLWDLFGAQIVMLVSVFILNICYKKSFSSLLDSFGKGLKKAGKLVIVFLLAYVILEFTVMYPIIPTIVNSFLGKSFNVFTTGLAALVTSLFTGEYQYLITMIGGFFSTSYADSLSVVSFILQSVYGIVSFLTPASAMLLVGLSYLDIPYKDWFKYIWKFIIVMLIVIVLFALILF